MTDNDRVLKALEAAGRVGITQVDFSAPNVTDGGKPITRLAARIFDLKQNGHVIVKAGVRNKCAVYTYMGYAKGGDSGEVAELAQIACEAIEALPVSLWQEAQVTPKPANALLGGEAA